MEKQKEIARAKANKCIENIQSGLQALETLPNLQDIVRMHISDMHGEIFIVASYNLETYRHNRRVLYANGWKASIAFPVDNGNRYTHLFNGNGNKISYIMEPHLPNSTCKKIKVGEETNEIFMVTCE